ncbi:MAG TPA: type 1 glutamine amidotransferase [Bacteroidales bacterium]
MRAHCFQHEPFEGMAALETWLRNKKFEISYTHFFESDQIPSLDSIDWLIVMGGSMSVNDENEFPWLKKEKEFVRECIKKGKVVIGICLGSQMIANSLGSQVYKNEHKEIGWFPIHKMNSFKSKLFEDFPNEITVFHWHGETFDLPDGAELIASSEACKHQIFTINDKVIGFQCHLETTDESLISLSDNCRAELKINPFIQSEMQMITDEKKYSSKMHDAFFKILEKI